MKSLHKILGLSLAAFFALGVVACDNSNDGPIDYVEQAKLNEYSTFTTYEDTNFLDHGIGLVTLYNAVDGDTAHFFQKETSNREERLVKVRFYGIDTPESTGQIEPWGKKASKFTTDALNSAGTIVLTNGELVGGAASPDSTGTRFKALVWIAEEENAPIENLRCLNLWVVQEGFSNGKGVADCPLAQLFNDADLQAQTLKRNMWSGEDPDFYKGDALVTSIKEIVDEFVENNGVCPTFEGVKVQINGVVVKVVDDDAYVAQDFEDEETGEIERYGMFIFAGYKHYSILKGIGNDLTITGTFTVRYGNPQITSVSYNEYLPSKDDMVLNATGVVKPFDEMTIPEVDGSRRHINLIGNFKNLTATGRGYNAVDQTTQVASGAMNIEFKDSSGNKIYLRVPKNVWVIEKDGGSLDRVEDYKYFYDNNLTIDLTAAIALYTPNSSDDSNDTRTYWQLTLCHKNDIVYH